MFRRITMPVALVGLAVTLMAGRVNAQAIAPNLSTGGIGGAVGGGSAAGSMVAPPSAMPGGGAAAPGIAIPAPYAPRYAPALSGGTRIRNPSVSYIDQSLVKRKMRRDAPRRHGHWHRRVHRHRH